MNVGKRIRVYLLAFLLFYLSVIVLSQASYQTYKNQTHGFSIEYPNSWQVKEEDSNYFIFQPPVSTSEFNEVAVEIYVSQEVEYTLEQSVNELLPEILGQFPGSSEKYRIDATIAGVDAKIVTTKFLDNKKQEVTMQLVFIIQDQTGYLLFLESYTNKLDSNKAILDYMLQSFSLSGALSSGFYGALSLGDSHDGVLEPASKEKKEIAYHSYTFEINEGFAEIVIELDGKGNDIDMAVKRGSEITTYDEDVCGCEFRDFSDSPNSRYLLNNPEPGILYIDVLSYREANSPYTIRIDGKKALKTNPLENRDTNHLGNRDQADLFVGIFSSDTLTLEIHKEAFRYVGELKFNGQVFPVIAKVSESKLVGSFESNGNSFEFVADLKGTLLNFETGGKNYLLNKENKIKNPLGN